MSEFDAFESAAQQPPQTEEDPAAAFLAREQDQLAELGDDTLMSGTAPTAATDAPAAQTDLFGGEAPAAATTAPPAGDDVLAAFDTPAAVPTSDATEDEAQEEGDAEADDGAEDAAPAQSPAEDAAPAEELADVTNPAAPIDDVLADFDSSAPQTTEEPFSTGEATFDAAPAADFGGGDSFAAIAQVDKERAEPEQIRIWREEHQARLEQKDADEREKMEEWRQIARQELEDWYKHRDEQLEKAKQGNKEAEGVFIKERDEKMPGHEWERICRNCEFNPKNNKSTKDNSRMRSILLQLKQTPLVR